MGAGLSTAQKQKYGQSDRSRSKVQSNAEPVSPHHETVVEKSPPTPSAPIGIGGYEAEDPWEDDPMLSRSAPVYGAHKHGAHNKGRGSGRPVQPRLKPVDPAADIMDLPDLDLPPPSLPETPELSKSVPLGRSLLETSMSCPPDIAIQNMQNMQLGESGGGAYSGSLGKAVVTGRGSRSASIIDMMSAGELAANNGMVEETDEDDQLDEERSDQSEDDDEDLPFK